MPKFATKTGYICKVVKQGEGEVSDLPLQKQWAQGNCRTRIKKQAWGMWGKGDWKRSGDYPAQA